MQSGCSELDPKADHSKMNNARLSRFLLPTFAEEVILSQAHVLFVGAPALAPSASVTNI
jgi:hypothetical protein